MMDTDDTQRDEFVEFLARVSAGQVSVEDWNRFTVTHYDEPELESVRAELALAAMTRGQCSARAIPVGLAAIAEEMQARLAGESWGRPNNNFHSS